MMVFNRARCWQFQARQGQHILHLHRLACDIDGQHIAACSASKQPSAISREAHAVDATPHTACRHLFTVDLAATQQQQQPQAQGMATTVGLCWQPVAQAAVPLGSDQGCSTAWQAASPGAVNHWFWNAAESMPLG